MLFVNTKNVTVKIAFRLGAFRIFPIKGLILESIVNSTVCRMLHVCVHSVIFTTNIQYILYTENETTVCIPIGSF